MKVCIYSPKGGSGTTTCAALVAKTLSISSPTIFIDACNGDSQILLNIEEIKFGFGDWLNSPEKSIESFKKISLNLTKNLNYVGPSIGNLISDTTDSQRNEMLSPLFSDETNMVFDCGLCKGQLQLDIANSCDLVIAVIRKCFLGLSAFINHDLKNLTDSIIVVSESGRSISTKQIADSSGVKQLIEIEARRDYANLIDAGVLVDKSPQEILKLFSNYFLDMERNSYQEFWDEPVNETDRYFAYIKSKLSI
ncbi:MAG: hypothetical protein U0R17_04330 [Acidimicrobiia bacterium]